jgi:hypothetical protein
MFPIRIEERIADLHTKCTYLKAMVNRAGIDITADEVTEFEGLLVIVDLRNAKWLVSDTRTKLDTIARKEAVDTAQKFARRLIEFYVAGNPAATEGDYDILRIPIPGARQPLPAPTTAPGITKLSSSDLAVLVSFFDTLTNKRGRPDNAQSLEIYYQLGGTEPTSISEMKERAVATATPYRLQFQFDDELKPVYLAFRWVGTRGDFSPWTQIYKLAVVR